MITTSLFLGFSTGLSLIVAIGAQNAFVLRQGIRRELVLLTVTLCALSDVVLIFAGVTGIGIVVEQAPWILTIARIGGAIFLVSYAFFALRRTIAPSGMESSSTPSPTTAWSIAGTALMLTWLNPHVYIDTVLLLGSIGASQGEESGAFAVGAMLASVLWFSALGYASRFLSRFFGKPSAWRVLDGLICIFMLAFATMLLAPLFTS